MLDAEYLRSRLDYNHETGVFIWKLKVCGSKDNTRWNSVWPGRIAGRVNGNGYCEIYIDGRRYPASHLAWCHVTGTLPGEDEMIDHINRDKTDNRFCNLRLACHSDNMCNKAAQRSSTTGFKGVYKRECGKFRANISKDGKRRNLGTFRTAEDAAKAYDKEARLLHGVFAVLNFPD